MIYRILLCIFIGGLTLYMHIDGQNGLTELRIAIPAMQKQVKQMHLENKRLQFEIDRFKSPTHLMELFNEPEFSHLRFPASDEVIMLPMTRPLED